MVPRGVLKRCSGTAMMRRRAMNDARTDPHEIGRAVAGDGYLELLGPMMRGAIVLRG